jgi:hypothetical protein
MGEPPLASDPTPRPPPPFPSPCTDGAGATMDDPPPESDDNRPAPPFPAPCRDGGGGTTCDPPPDNAPILPAPPRPSSKTEGGGGTTDAPAPGIEFNPLPPPSVPCTDGGGGTTPAAMEPGRPSPKGLLFPCSESCTLGGGAITPPPGPWIARPPETPATSGGGSTTEVCDSPPRRPLARLTSGGGATTEVQSDGNVSFARPVAAKGAEGIAGFAEARFGARARPATLASGAATAFDPRRCSRDTRIAACRGDSCRARAGACLGGALLRAENVFEGG